MPLKQPQSRALGRGRGLMLAAQITKLVVLPDPGAQARAGYGAVTFSRLKDASLYSILWDQPDDDPISSPRIRAESSQVG